MNPVSALESLGGVARSHELLHAGVSPYQLRLALTRQAILKPVRGVYCLPDHDSDRYAAACAGAELACISAAKQLGLWILCRPSLIHVSVNHGRALHSRFRTHRLEEPLTPLVICLQCMRCLPELDALCIVESAVVHGYVSLDRLRHAPGIQSSSWRS